MAGNRSHNEDGSVSVVFNGELFDYPEMKAELEASGPSLPHALRHRTDPASLGRASRDDVRASARPVRRRPVTTPTAAGRCSAAIASASVRCTGRGRRTGRRLAAVRLRDQGTAGLRHGRGPARSCAASTTSSPSSRCPGRSPASRASSCCRPGIPAHPAGRRWRRRRRSANTPYWQMDYPDRGKEERQHAGQVFDELGAGAAGGGDAAIAPMCRSCRISPAASIRAWSWRWRASYAARRSRASPFASSVRSWTKRREAAIVARHIGAEPIVVDCGTDEVLEHLPGPHRRRGGAGHRHFVRRAADAVAAKSTARLQGGADRRRVRRMAGRLSLAQDQPRSRAGST